MSGKVRTTCPYCGVGCGVLAIPDGDSVRIEGDLDHPANGGLLCSKGSALGETLGMKTRLLRPQIDGRQVDWDTALNTVACGFATAIAEHGPDSVALYVSGQLLTEDYYVANKLMKGFIGSANIDTNSRLCMSSAVAAHKRAFGEDLVPITYEDLELADLIVLVGSNLAWCHPVLYQRIARAKQRRPEMRVVVIDPRRTPTCDIADLHLPLRAGTDVWLFNGLFVSLAREGRIEQDYIAQHTQGFSQALVAAENTAGDAGAVARRCGLTVADVQQFYSWFAGTERVVTAFSQGVNQSSAGADKANAIINVHLITGRIGKPGMGPFSVTGQPNAMGGREVGGLANTLAAHMDLDNAEHRELVQSFWQSPKMADRPGLKAVDLFEAIHEGRIKAIWIMGTNPLVSLPNADRAREALKRCPLVVVSEVVTRTDTTAHAHVLLPALAWGEKDGTVTNSDRHISRQRAFLDSPGEARADWWIISQVAMRLGFGPAFAYECPAEIFDEHARLSAAGNDGGRVFNLKSLAGLARLDYETLRPTQWPPTPDASSSRLFADGRFSFPDGRARIVALRPRLPTFCLDREYPLVLNTGRIRDQWHTMTRTGLSGRLSAHLSEPFVDVHPADASVFGVQLGGLARITTRWGHLIARVRSSGEIARGSVFVPIHWNSTNATDARVGAVVNPSVDPVSGEPEFKHTPARIEAFVVNWHGFVLTRGEFSGRATNWWTRVEGGHFRRHEFTGRSVPRHWPTWARAALNADEKADWIDYVDAASGTYRAALFREDRLEACIYISPRRDLPSRTWAAAWFDKTSLSVHDRMALLSSRAVVGAGDIGNTICSCFRIGDRAIRAAVMQGCRDAQAVGRTLKAGTNCGSCIPEIRNIIAAFETEKYSVRRLPDVEGLRH
jgi:assimilatory nitrate reductase catalytic subunit